MRSALWRSALLRLAPMEIGVAGRLRDHLKPAAQCSKGAYFGPATEFHALTPCFKMLRCLGFAIARVSLCHYASSF